jgi:hypothetical protein
LDVTAFFLSTRAAAEQFLGFNLRTDDSLPPGTTVDNFFQSPRLTMSVIPEPSTMSVAAAALAVGACTWFRKTKGNAAMRLTGRIVLRSHST